MSLNNLQSTRSFNTYTVIVLWCESYKCNKTNLLIAIAIFVVCTYRVRVFIVFLKKKKQTLASK